MSKMVTEKRKDCDNCKNSDRPSYEWPCTACTTSFGGPPTKWESIVPIHADLVEVVRCKDCKYWKHFDHLGCTDFVKVCTLAYYMIGENGYCLYGERKDNGQ